MNDDIKLGSRIGLWWLIGGAVAIVIILLLASMWVFGYGFFTDATANRQGETQKKQQVEGNGSYRIAAYDHFYDACAAVQTIEQTITNSQRAPTETTDPDRKMQIEANIDAQRNERADAINQYNADARKKYTLGQFKSSDLPFQLKITKRETSCHA